MTYPHGIITLRKLEEMVDNPNDWVVIVKNNYTNEKIPIKNRDDLREYAFYTDYSFGYEFVGNWKEYTKPKNTNEILYDWKMKDIEIRIRRNELISAEIVKWENNKPSAKDTRSCFVIAYWNHNDLVLMNDFFKYIPWYMKLIVYSKIRFVQYLLPKLYSFSDME